MKFAINKFGGFRLVPDDYELENGEVIFEGETSPTDEEVEKLVGKSKEYKETKKQTNNQLIYDQLNALDIKRIRPMVEDDQEYLDKLNKEAVELRSKLIK